jgi:two-component system CheB/CheR fusion protein
LRAKNGSIRDVVIDSSVLFEGGKFVHTRCFTRDITDRKQAQEARLRLAAIVDFSEDAIISKDLNGIVTSWNNAAERIFGWTAAEMIGRSILTLIPPELHSDEDMILGKIRSGERIEHFETERLHKDGHRLQVSLTISPVKDGNGHIIGAAKIARDITDQRRRDEALRRAEKMAATGRLAASIAHEINNPLQALSNLVALIQYRTALDDNTRQLVGLAQTEVARMSHIARQMLSFYRESPAPIPLKVTDLLEDVLELVERRAHANGIRIERNYRTSSEIAGYPIELRQLFINLLTNAVEAIAQRGTIRVRVARGIDWRTRRTGVRVTIADSGCGVPPEIRRRLYEAFFTTKSERGTGLGLWVARGIVEKHEGRLQMRSRTTANSGTVFSVFLPTQSPWRSLQAASGETAA